MEEEKEGEILLKSRAWFFNSSAQALLDLDNSISRHAPGQLTLTMGGKISQDQKPNREKIRIAWLSFRKKAQPSLVYPNESKYASRICVGLWRWREDRRA